MIDSRNVFISYLKSTFVIDVLATIPLILANNSQHILFLRLLHIFDIKLAQMPIFALMKIVFPGSPTARINFGLFLVYIFYFMILTHLIVAVWLWLGDKYLMGD